MGNKQSWISLFSLVQSCQLLITLKLTITPGIYSEISFVCSLNSPPSILDSYIIFLILGKFCSCQISSSPSISSPVLVPDFFQDFYLLFFYIQNDNPYTQNYHHFQTFQLFYQIFVSSLIVRVSSVLFNFQSLNVSLLL